MEIDFHACALVPSVEQSHIMRFNRNVNRENLPFFTALASETRLHIIELLSGQSLNLRELADALGISVAIVSRHVKTLEAVGILRCTNLPGGHGLQKLCSLACNGLVLNYRSEKILPNIQMYQIPVGSYVDWSVYPTCGLSTAAALIGEVDDPRYFADPAHTEAQMIWVGAGYLEYIIPNYMTAHQRVTSIRFQLELCSEAPHYNEHWPSDIRFHINNHYVGYWTCPGDFGERKGVLTPEWWTYGTQYGMLKTLSVTEDGTFIDGSPISGITIEDLNIVYGQSIHFKIESPRDAENAGGFCLFGKNFGNYNQDINVSVEYQAKRSS